MVFPTVTQNIPGHVLRFLSNFAPLKALHNFIRITDTMHNISSGVWEEKKARLAQGDDAIVNQVNDGMDLLSILRELLACLAGISIDLRILVTANNNASEEDRLADETLLAQMSFVIYCFFIICVMCSPRCSTLVFAGTDTTSSALSRTLHLLAVHPEVQERLRREVNELHSDRISYDELVNLPYLEAVCRETLRL